MDWKNKEDVNAYYRIRYLSRKEEYLIRQRIYRKTHRGKVRKAACIYRSEHLEETRAKNRRWYQKHKKEIRVYKCAKRDKDREALFFGRMMLTGQAVGKMIESKVLAL